MTKPEGDQWLDRYEAAAVAGVDITTLWRWTKSGRLRGFKYPNAIRGTYFRREDVLAAITPSIPLGSSEGVGEDHGA